MTGELPRIDVARAVELLREAVAERGADYVDPRAAASRECAYVKDGQCACLIALALHKGGVTIDTLRGFVGEIREAIDALVERGVDIGVWIVEDAVGVLEAAQSVQDLGGTWGNALVAAERFAQGGVPS